MKYSTSVIIWLYGLLLAFRAAAAVGGFGTPGTIHGDGLPTVAPKAYLELRGTYFTADSDFQGKAQTVHDIVKDAVIPDVSMQLHLQDEWWLSMRVFCPFGSGTHYDEYWQGAFHLVDCGFQSVNVTPGILWANGTVAIYAAPQIEIIRKVAFSQAMFLPGIIGEIDGGDAWAVGGHLAVAYKPWDNTEFRLGYWSRMEHNLNDGQAHASIWGLADLGLGGTRIEIRTPDVIAAKIEHTLSPEWCIWGLAEYTFWKSVLGELRVNYDLPVLPDSVIRYDAKDTVFFQLGAKWHPNESPWSILATMGWGSSFTTDARRHPSLIGGATWHLGTEARYTWPSGVSAFLGVKCIKWETGVSELPGASLPYGFPFGTLFGQLHGDYHATVYRFETGVTIPL